MQKEDQTGPINADGPTFREPHELLATAIHLTGLAEVLYEALNNAQYSGEMSGVANIGFGYDALAELAKKLANEIADYT